MKSAHWLLALLAIVLGSSCRSLYIPNGPNVPLMSEGDELQLGASIGTNGYAAQIAYSPYYHWAIAATGNTFTIRGGSGYSRNQVSFRHIYGEAATGFYTRLGKYARLELLGGYGEGNSGHPEDNKRLYRKVFAQPSIGISGPWLDAGFTPRLSFVNHYLTFADGLKTKSDLPSAFFEPTLTLRAGYEEMKFQFQYGRSFRLGDVPYSYKSSFVGFGFHLTFVKDFDKYK